MYDSASPAELDQACIVRNAPFYAIRERREAIVLTPRCDILQGKVDYVSYCALYSLREFVVGSLRGSWRHANNVNHLNDDGTFIDNLTATQRNTFRKIVRDRAGLIPRNQQWRYHWLDLIDDETASIVDFELVKRCRFEKPPNSSN